MPYSDTKNLPAAFKKQPARVKRKGLAILNALLEEGMDEGKAIRIALSRAQKWAREHAVKAGGSMKEGGEFWFDEESGRYFVGFTATTRFFKGWTDDPEDETPCFETTVVTDDVDKDSQWFSEDCMKALANAGDVPLLVGDSHSAAMLNATSKVGVATEHEISHRNGATTLVAKGQFDASHPNAAWLIKQAQMNPAEYATSIGGWVAPEWVEVDALHKSGQRGLRIDKMERDHYFLTRASATRNPHTDFTYAAAVGKALGGFGGEDESATEEVVEKAWAGLSDSQVRRAVQEKLYEVKREDEDTVSGWPYVIELYEHFAIVEGDDGTYYKLTLSARGGELIVGKPGEVKRTYVEKCWIDRYYPMGEKDEAIHARTRVMRRRIGWAVALPAVHKACETFDLPWDRDVFGEPIDPAILAEEEEVLKAATEAALENSMVTTEDKKGVVRRVAEALGLTADEIEAPTEKAGEEEPKVEMHGSDLTLAILELAKATKAGFEAMGEQLSALAKAEEPEPEAGDEKPAAKPEGDTDEPEADAEAPKEPDADADAEPVAALGGDVDADAEPVAADGEPSEVETLKATIAAMDEKIAAMSVNQAKLVDELAQVSKASGISRALPESAEAGEPAEEAGLGAVIVDQMKRIGALPQ